MNRQFEIKVRFSHDELQSLNKKVKRTDMSREHYVRTLCNNKLPVEIPPADYYSLIQEVQNLGNSMHQIAHKVISTGALDASFYRQNAERIIKIADKLLAVCLPKDSS